MKKKMTALGIVLLVLLVAAFAKDLLVKTAVEKGVEFVTGLQLKIKSFGVGILNTRVAIKDMKLYNPLGYQDRVMLNMPEIYVDYNLPALFKGKVYAEEIRINMKEFTVVKNEKGELNLDSLKVVQAQKKGKEPEDVDKKGGKAPEIQIDILELKIGKVVYKDYSGKGSPSVREINVNIDERFENISNPYSLVSIIVVKALIRANISNLVNIDIKALESTVSDTLATATKVTEQASVAAQETVQKTAEVAGEAVNTTKEALGKTTEGITNAFKIPFGSGDKK